MREVVTAKPDYHVPTLVVLLTKKKRPRNPQGNQKDEIIGETVTVPQQKGRKMSNLVVGERPGHAQGSLTPILCGSQPDLSHLVDVFSFSSLALDTESRSSKRYSSTGASATRRVPATSRQPCPLPSVVLGRVEEYIKR